MTFPTILLLAEMTFPVVLLLAALGLLLIGLLGKIKIKEWEFGTESKRIRVMIASIGVVLLLAAFLVYQSDKRIRSDNSNSANINIQPSPTVSSSPIPTPTITPTSTPPLPEPDTLIQIILREQRDNVRESYAESAGQNFSDVNLQNFKKTGKLAEIIKRLKTDAEFLDVVLAIKRMTPSARQKLLHQGLNTFKPTWQQLGRIDRAGQTDAGQEAERMIAEGIVNLVKELSARSDEEIKKLQG